MAQKYNHNEPELNMSISVSEDTSEIKDGYVNLRSRRCNEYESSADSPKALHGFMAEMRQLMNDFSASQKYELRNINNTLSELKQTNIEIQSSINFLSEQNNQLKNRITTLEDDIKDNRDYIILLENKLENSEISSRKTNLELKNVPMLPDETKEKLINMTSSLFKNIDCEVSR
ncbi:unnamed protein product, partial [Leptidea sinapis]